MVLPFVPSLSIFIVEFRLYSYCVCTTFPPALPKISFTAISASTNLPHFLILSHSHPVTEPFSHESSHSMLDENIVEGGFVRVMIEARMEDLTNRSKNMEEDVQVIAFTLPPIYDPYPS